MATGTQGDSGQRYHTNQVHYLMKRFTYDEIEGKTLVVGNLPPNNFVRYGHTHIITGFDDTNGDDLDIGVRGGDDDLFASAVDMNSNALTTFDDLALANQWSATARTVTCNLTTAASGDGAAGEAVVYLEYYIADDNT